MAELINQKLEIGGVDVLERREMRAMFGLAGEQLARNALA